MLENNPAKQNQNPFFPSAQQKSLYVNSVILLLSQKIRSSNEFFGGVDKTEKGEMKNMANKRPARGLFEYGQNQKSKGKDLKLFPNMGDLNPALKENPRKRRG